MVKQNAGKTEQYFKYGAGFRNENEQPGISWWNARLSVNMPMWIRYDFRS